MQWRDVVGLGKPVEEEFVIACKFGVSAVDVASASDILVSDVSERGPHHRVHLGLDVISF